MTPTQLTSTIEPLFACLASRRGDDDIKRYIAGCAFSLKGIPLDAVKAAVERYCRGEVECHDARWRPEPAELARLARVIDKPARVRREQLRRRESMRIEGPEPEAVSRERKAEILRLAGIKPVADRQWSTRDAARKQLAAIMGPDVLDGIPEANDETARRVHMDAARGWLDDGQ